MAHAAGLNPELASELADLKTEAAAILGRIEYLASLTTLPPRVVAQRLQGAPPRG